MLRQQLQGSAVSEHVWYRAVGHCTVSWALTSACFPPLTRLDSMSSLPIFSAMVFFIVITQNNLQNYYSHRIPKVLYI